MITTALIGSPVDHSVSPKLFKLYAKEHNLEYSHSKFDVNPKNLEKVIRSLQAYGFSGVNITLPYKASVAPFMDYISEEAKSIGAINTIKVNGDKLEGYNTDSLGAIRAIEKSMDRKIDDRDISIVLGTGGASRAIIWGLLQANSKVTVIYRNPESIRTKTIKIDFPNVEFIDYEDFDYNLLSKSTILCNGTSVGMYPNNEECPLDLNKISDIQISNLVVFDAIFNPNITKLQSWAKNKGSTLAYGMDMMIYQGVVAFEYWTGKKVSEETIKQAFEMLINK